MKKQLLSLILGLAALLTSLNGFTQNITFQTTELSQSQNIPRLTFGTVASADVDGDGDMDLVMAGRNITSPYEKETLLYLNNGNGTFESASNILEGVAFGCSIEFADIDGDNDADLFISGIDENNERISLLYSNNGVGDFSYLASSIDSIGYGDVAFSDVDNDNDLDLFISGSSASGPGISKLYLNDGSGLYTEDVANTFEGVIYSSVAFADVDGDNDDDLLVTGRNSLAQPISKLYINDGGTFLEDVNNAFEGVWYSSVAFSDIDGDSDVDLLIVGENSSGQKVENLYENSGNGVFTEIANPGVNMVSESQNEVTFADVDNDGDDDLIVLDDGNGAWTKVYNNDGTGNFTNTGQTFNQAESGSICIADLNNDNANDIVIVSGAGANSSAYYYHGVYMNVGNGTFSTDGIFFSGNVAMAVADIDGDSDEDVLTSSQLKMHLNDGLGNYGFQANTIFNQYTIEEIVFEDVDNDNDEDVFIVGVDENLQKVSKLFFNDGSGSYTEGTSSFDGVTLSASAFEDVDNDGDKDLLLTGFTGSGSPISGIAKLYINNGSGVFTEQTGSSFIGVNQSSIAFSDVDNDGDKDVFIAGYSQASGVISKLYNNNGSGVYTEVVGTSFVPSYSGAVRVADIDGDTDDDVMFMRFNWGAVPVLYENDGQGNFTEVLGTPFDLVAGDFVFTDIDDDGDPDVVITGNINNTTGNTRIYANDGQGNFALIETLNTSLRQSSLVIANNNGDDKKDILLSGIRTWNGSNTPRTYLYTQVCHDYDITLEDTLCKGDLFTYPNGQEIVVSGNTSSTYATNTLFGGCDSVITQVIRVEFPHIVSDYQCGTDSVILSYEGTLEPLSSIVWTGGVLDGVQSEIPSVETTYYVSATTSAGCLVEDSITLTPVVDYFLEYQNGLGGYALFCNDQTNTLSYLFDGAGQWSDLGWNNNLQSGSTFIPNSSNTYIHYAEHQVTGCIDSVVANVQVIDLTLYSENEYCGGDGSAYVQITENIGSGSYYPEWSTGEPGSLTNATAGYYTVEVTDINTGCQETAGVTIGPSPSSDEVFLTNLAFYDQPTVIGTPFENYFPNLPDTMIYNTTNPRNLINRGSLVRLKIECQNEQFNGQSIVGGECRIRSKSPWITVLDSVSNLNNVAWGARAWSVDEFEIFIEPFIVDTNWSGNQYTLDTIYDPNFSGFSGNDLKPLLEFLVVEGNNEWLTTCVPIPIEPLEVSFWDSQVDDDNNPDSSGDNDMIVEPSEIIEYNPALRNISELDAELVHGTFENLDDHSSISIWDNVSGVSGTVVSSSWWNYQFNQPQPILASSSTPMYPQFDFVFEYNDTATFQFDLHLVLGGGFKLFGSVDTALIMWSTPTTFNEGYPMIPTSGTNPSSVAETLKGSVLLYPNPTNGQFTITGVAAANYSVEVYNNMGQLLLRQDAVQANTTLNLQEQAAGVYHVHVITNDNVSRFKLVKE